MDFEPKNILIIHFGQIGDVILCLPALQALRKRFNDAKITVLVGKSAKAIVELSELFDEIIIVDRVKLRDGKKLSSIRKIFKLIFDTRHHKFDFVIDLHSLPETNLLGFISGANHRFFVRRGSRSVDFLSNFRPSSPVLDKFIHTADFYLKNLEPLGIKNVPRSFELHPPANDIEMVRNILRSDKIDDKNLIGINIGAGHPIRDWGLQKFSELASKISETDNTIRIIVFFGPEESHLEQEIKAAFSSNVIFYHKLTLKELAAAFTFLKLLIGNDTGPMHLGAIVGTPVLTITNPGHFRPLGENVHYVKSSLHHKISVDEAFQKARTII